MTDNFNKNNSVDVGNFGMPKYLDEDVHMEYLHYTYFYAPGYMAFFSKEMCIVR